MSFLPGWFPGPVMAAEHDATIAFASYGMSASNPASSYNYGSKNIGAAHPSRVLIAAILWAPMTSGTFGSLSVDGTPMTSRLAFQSSGTIRVHTLPWPTGTTATIVANIGTGSFQSCEWMIWSAYFLKSEVPTASSWIVAGGNPISGNIAVLSGGVAIGNVETGSSSSGHSWSGITEDLDTLGGIGNIYRMSGASGAFHAAQSPLTVTTNAGANHSQLIASFR